jgi:hypothetical protein
LYNSSGIDYTTAIQLLHSKGFAIMFSRSTIEISCYKNPYFHPDQRIEQSFTYAPPAEIK